MTQPIRIFYPYASEDRDLREALARHLKTLKRQQLIKDWYDRCIPPGGEWTSAIDEHLESADIVLLLASSERRGLAGGFPGA